MSSRRCRARQVALDLADQLRVVRAVAVEPEHGRRPVARARFTASFTQSRMARPWSGRRARCRPPRRRAPRACVPVGVHDAHGAVGGDLEGLVVRAVLLRLLRHQPDVGHAAHGRRVELAVRLAVLDDRLVDAGVAGVGDHRLGVLQLARGVPHPAAVADHRRHGRVDDDVAGHVQVGDAAVRVDHGDRRALLVDGAGCRPRWPRAARPAAARSSRRRRRTRCSGSRRALQHRACFSKTSSKKTRTRGRR
jgi:hypothetical protein